MKYINSLSIFIVLSMLLIACETKHKSKNENKSPEPKEDTIEHDHASDEIQLNEGAKWKVDDSMMVYIRNMQSSVIDFIPKEEYTFHELSDSLQINISLLTSNCTMKGPAHDELHKWLIPYMELVNHLSEAENEAEFGKWYKEIKLSFETFNQYFE